MINEIKNTYIIAEIGVNHNGSIEMAKELISAAKKCGADAVKFQSFSAERLVTQSAPKVAYQKLSSDMAQSHFDMLNELQLTEEQHRILHDFCETSKIDFISTPYDVDWAKFLINELNLKKIKTASADLVDMELHSYLSGQSPEIIIATGMANLGEIEATVQQYVSEGKDNLYLLQCTSNYPCSDSSVNLTMIQTLAQAFGYQVGFSDHTIGDTAALGAVTLGAKVIEKHFTLDRSMKGPDHKASSTPSDFAKMITQIRRIEKMLGDGLKKVEKEEVEMRSVSRKSLHYASDLQSGHTLTSDDVVSMRPGNGVAPHFKRQLIGCKLVTSVKKHELVDTKDLN